MRRKRLVVLLGSAAILIVAMVVVWCVRRPKALYRVAFLPSMGGVQTYVHAINDSGRVAASVRMADGTTRIVLWDKSGRTEDLASLPKGHYVTVLAINNAGQVAGTVLDPNHVWSSFFWDADGRKCMLDAPGAEQTRIGALNNRGQVVGHWSATRGPRHAFIWDRATGMRDLGTFGGIESLACDINDWGQVVGYFSTMRNDWRAFVYDPNLGMQELGPMPFGPRGTCRINNRGFVVGQFGSTRDGECVSTWTARDGPKRLPSAGGDDLEICGLDETDRYLLNVHHKGIRLLGRNLRARSESHLWESRRHVRCLNEHLGRADIGGLDVCDINKDGTILGLLVVKKLPYPHAVILEPIR